MVESSALWLKVMLCGLTLYYMRGRATLCKDKKKIAVDFSVGAPKVLIFQDAVVFAATFALL